MLKIDLRYDIGNKERVINVLPWFRIGLWLYGLLWSQRLLYLKKIIFKH